ncbi:conserved hypothetical protein [Culex quinquefasciatus]|uniref:Uncharacterized protein n=1 Tax=Culex quinquefasciatus TaxID=7176 RepID=B0WBS1_CULQU|nr:conserved hypothetical protein [Culex quinquefasciatus]|eukprot:XP_001846155.1 conserved hypothetical protein [Culex quinquefasciatus]
MSGGAKNFGHQFSSKAQKSSFDVRGKPLQQARHWSAPESFGPRAHFNTDTDPATLDIQF